MLPLYPLEELHNMNKLMTQTLILSSLLTLATWAQAADNAATAAPGTPHPKSLFAQADKDGDGKLNSSEFAELQALRDAEIAKHRAARPDFATLDKDGDGLLSQEELRAGRAGKAHPGGRHGGRDGMCGGGKHSPMFTQADADKNGTLSEAEYQQLLKERQERQAQMNAATPDFKTLDTNGDGQLSQDELRAGMQKNFKLMAQPAAE
jgi:Ca2+-binding EF-hand superfamily protein